MASHGRRHQDPVIIVIDFHHARGPEVELCIADEGTNPPLDNDWSLLPFMALADGAHTYSENFSYFTLCRKETATEQAVSLFGISCSRQIDSNLIINRGPDVTRSTVQKAVVVVTENPQSIGQLREKLSVVTSAWFAQRDFSDVVILKKFRESLLVKRDNEGERTDRSLGLSLREMIHELKYQTLVLFKALLLQPKMLFFGSRCERLCMIQFSLISLIPGLMDSLQDCADPAFDSYAQTVEKPTSLKTSERNSLLAYMGLPLQIFGKGSMFGPYTPLQQLDLLADDGTKSYVAGSTNSLLLQQKDHYSDVFVNLDEDTVGISSPSLRSALALSAADRRWIDLLAQIINDTWDDAHPERPKTLGYMGSEEFIRLQFEEYLLALLSCMKYHEELSSFSAGDSGHRSKGELLALNIEGDPALEFNSDFLTQWQSTSNYALFKRLTSDAILFSVVEPRHPCAGGLSIEDIQRRLGQQVAELHLDDRVREGREVLNRGLATGQKKVSAVFNSFWSDIEAMREAQRTRNEERDLQSQRSSMDLANPPSSISADLASVTQDANSTGWFGAQRAPSIDIAQAQAVVGTASQRASAYISSWGVWAYEKRKEWQEKKSSPVSSLAISSPSTLTLDSVTDARKGRSREQSVHRTSEDSTNPARGMTRKEMWNNAVVRRESGDSVFSHKKSNSSSESNGNDMPPIQPSPLEQTSALGHGETIEWQDSILSEHRTPSSSQNTNNEQEERSLLAEAYSS